MRKNIKRKSFIDYNWIFKLILLTFIITILFSFVAETAIPNIGIIFGIILTIVIILIGVLFDMVGVAVATSDEAPLHSMASKKVKGAKTAIKLKRNADKVSSFCNDVVGDICGIISGSTGAVIAIKLTTLLKGNNLLIILITMSIISCLTIGGKAIVKGYALYKSDKILFRFAKIISMFVKE